VKANWRNFKVIKLSKKRSGKFSALASCCLVSSEGFKSPFSIFDKLLE
jgi:hypothetical protein